MLGGWDWAASVCVHPVGPARPLRFDGFACTLLLHEVSLHESHRQPPVQPAALLQGALLFTFHTDPKSCGKQLIVSKSFMVPM